MIKDNHFYRLYTRSSFCMLSNCICSRVVQTFNVSIAAFKLHGLYYLIILPYIYIPKKVYNMYLKYHPK